MHTTLADWIHHDTVSFSMDTPDSLNAAIDTLVGQLNAAVELLGFGEALHGGEDILILRNQLFQRLVEAHGFSAIAVESSFPRGRQVNQYVMGDDTASFEAIQETGFSHNFGRLAANRELIEWMRAYNADPSHATKLHFYGFDSPTEMYATDSPSHLLHFALDYLDSIGAAYARERRDRIDALLGDDGAWENPAALMDPSQGIGLSANAAALRIETEDLITQLEIHRPEWAARSSADAHAEALHHARMARQMLGYHAGLARQSDQRLSDLLGIRDSIMADALSYIVDRERGRGKVLAFAHNRHLQRSAIRWLLGPNDIRWWPAGAQMDAMLGSRYAVIGTGLGVSAENGIETPESGSLEALLTASSEPALFIPTYMGQGLPTPEIAALPTRSGSVRNSMYMPLGSESFADFDWLAVLQASSYTRGGPELLPI